MAVTGGVHKRSPPAAVRNVDARLGCEEHIDDLLECVHCSAVKRALTFEIHIIEGVWRGE